MASTTPSPQSLAVDSCILHVAACHHEWQGYGALSIKTFTHGAAYYRVGAARYLVNEACYLLLNQDQEYQVTIDAPTPVESFCLFFPADFVAALFYSIAADSEQLLADPVPPARATLGLYERTYPHDQTLSPFLFQLRQAYRQAPRHEPHSQHWVEEQLHVILAQLLYQQQVIRREVAAQPAKRAATREELYRRLHYARDYMLASLPQPLSLAEMAAVAALSPNHFLRSFKALFHESPHAYLTTQRLARARVLLTTTDLPVTEVCLAVGFESLGSFSARFRREFGMAPLRYRQLYK